MLKAIGVVRVSQTAGRSGDSFHSPDQQRDRIAGECVRRGLNLIEVLEELDVSGGRPLKDRPGLSEAVVAIENGEANVLVTAYLDRLARSIRVREEVIERVEAVGGMVLAVDMGIQTNDTASQWLTGTISGAMDEYQRRATAERVADAQQRALNRGVPLFEGTPPGYKRRVIGRHPNGRKIHGPLQVDEDLAPIIRRAFEMRAENETIASVREFLREQGVERSYHGVQAMLKSRVYLGQLHFGRYEPNLNAHPRIIDDDLWQRTQSASGGARGRRPHSDRILARLGVLRCGTCGARMVVGSAHFGKYPLYRCPPVGDCPRRVSISAKIAETFVIETTKKALAGMTGRTSAMREAALAEADAEKAQANLDAAIRAFDGIDTEPAVLEKISELRAVRDAAVEQRDHLRSLRATYTVTIDDWDRFLLAEQRALIRASIDRVEVASGGRGVGRLSAVLRIE